jgi:hypothetical protein
LKRNQKLLTAGTLVLAVVVFGSWQMHQNAQLKKQINQLQGADKSAAEIQELVSKVSKLIVLPENEEPTVATVTDPEKLSSQDFFSSAQTGDKVLIYASAQKAILYRPSEGKIIEVAPINADANAQGQVAGAAEVKDKAQVPIKVQNGSKVTGLARKVADQLKTAGFTSVTVSDAPAGTSDTTSITYGDQYRGNINDIKKALGNQGEALAQVGATEIIIVLGQDFKTE